MFFIDVHHFIHTLAFLELVQQHGAVRPIVRMFLDQQVEGVKEEYSKVVALVQGHHSKPLFLPLGNRNVQTTYTSIFLECWMVALLCPPASCHSAFLEWACRKHKI